MHRLLKKLVSAQQRRAQKEPPAKKVPRPDIFTLKGDIAKDLKRFKEAFGESSDIKYHEMRLGNAKADKCAIIFTDGMSDNKIVSESIVQPLITFTESLPERGAAEFLCKKILFSGDTQVTGDSYELISGCLSGDTVLIIDGCKKGAILGSKGFETRSISEPQSELVVRGPREGFTENLRTNTSLLRRRIKNSQLKIESAVIGNKTATDICIAYIKGIAKESLIEEVRSRLSMLDVDAILDSGYVEEYIEDYPLALFPTVAYSEKPDVICGKMLEGRVAILVNGSPFVLTVPQLFVENFQTSEDYYIRPLYASLLRFMRVVSYLISIFTVPVYIAMTTFHQELIPTTLLLTIANAREGTPFPMLIEGLILVVSFEILREAGLRLPRPVGQAISIVGALIMGDAAVAAGIVGAPMVIMVAISSVAGFVVPNQVECISFLRVVFMLLAAMLGGYGIALGLMALLHHLASLRSFGVIYFKAFTSLSDEQDGIVRMPLWTMRRRPENIAGNNKNRINTFIPPNTSKKESEGK